jgi:prepilin-type processing-associated H-X9-DG protein
VGDGESDWLDRRVDVIGGIGQWPLPEETIPEVCQRFDRLAGDWAPHFSHVGRNWAFPGPGYTGYTHVLTPNSPVADCGSIDPEMLGAISARSRHSGGVNVVYFDGHCETVSPAIDAEVWLRQSLIADPLQ